MIDPARKAYIVRKRRMIRAQQRRLQRRALLLRLRKLSLDARLILLKTPDYLAALLLVFFRRHAPIPPTDQRS
jgi:hypothetical protein